MKTDYQTISFSDITLSPSAQIAIRNMQIDEEKVICNNLHEIALSLCEKEYQPEKASRALELVHSVLLARDYISVIGTIDKDV